MIFMMKKFRKMLEKICAQKLQKKFLTPKLK